MNYCLIPDRLKKAMIEKGFNKKTLSEVTGVSINDINTIIDQRGTPSERVIDSFAKAMNINQKYLKGEIESMLLPDEIEKNNEKDNIIKRIAKHKLPKTGGRPVKNFNSMDFCKIIADKGLTYDELSKYTRIRPSTINRWVSGNGAPTVNYALYLSKILDVPLDNFIDGGWRPSKGYSSSYKTDIAGMSVNDTTNSITINSKDAETQKPASGRFKLGKTNLFVAAKAFADQLNTYPTRVIVTMEDILVSLEKLNDDGLDRARYLIDEMTDNKRYQK